MLRPSKRILAWVIAGLALLLAAGPVLAQQTTKAPSPAPPKTYKMTTPIPPIIPMPDKLKTP